MVHKLVVLPLNKGQRTDRTAFNIDNDSFPVLLNAYQWRGRVKRKRGTSPLTRLMRFFDSTSASYTSTSSFNLVSGEGNLITGFSLQANSNIVPGSISISVAGNVYTDVNMDGSLQGAPTGTGTIIYSTGAITITGGAGSAVSGSFSYYPGLPVMDEDEAFILNTAQSLQIAFDTIYSYNIIRAQPYNSYDISFYKNPPSAVYPSYVQKTVVTPTSWNGQDYQQFWTVSYQGAYWATNGITVPFDSTNIGMQFAPAIDITVSSQTATTITLVIVNCPLVVGDFVFLNEFGASTLANAQTINFQTGYVTSITGTPASLTVVITLPNAMLATDTYTPGIVQYLTNRSDITKDCLRWYDGDPTNGSASAPTLTGNLGWVNFMPPLSQNPYIIADNVARDYYLVGARVIVPFKNRLLFFGAVIQASTGDPIYLPDTVVFSQDGSPYYTASFQGDPVSSGTVFTPILVPINQSAVASAYFEDQTGFGGFAQVGLEQSITSVGKNEDVLITALSQAQTRLVFTGNDAFPFVFYLINSELGTQSTFSTIVFDKAVMTKGNRGFVITAQTGAERQDLEIPDQVFEIKLTDNGNERVTSQRDFRNEWAYFTYPNDQSSYRFPTQTLQYNYRDNSWAVFDEAYTCYGPFRPTTGGFIWSTVGETYPTWSSWNVPWNSGASQQLQRKVVGGNQQGFILFREDNTDEAYSLSITAFSGNSITCPNHCLNQDDYILINNCLGTIGAQVNGKIFQVASITDDNTFLINPSIASGTYFGLGLIKRMYVPFIQTKQFPLAWDMARKIRIGTQQYLLSTTDNAQIQLLIYLSQNNENAYNDGPIIPESGVDNGSLIYSTILYTCPESTNLGLTPVNTNLQMIAEPGAGTSDQDQIWHRVNTSLIGDSVQLGFSMSDTQMRSFNSTSEVFIITGITQAYPCVITSTNELSAGSMISINGVQGMTGINYNGNQTTIYQVMSANATTVTINLDSTAFNAYMSSGTITVMEMPNQFEEIELHGFIIDVSPSQLLA